MIKRTVFDDPKFNKMFPETYDWHLVDSHSLSEMGIALKFKILKELKTFERDLVPGLRIALHEIAKRALIR